MQFFNFLFIRFFFIHYVVRARVYSKNNINLFIVLITRFKICKNAISLSSIISAFTLFVSWD